MYLVFGKGSPKNLDWIETADVKDSVLYSINMSSQNTLSADVYVFQKILI